MLTAGIETGDSFVAVEGDRRSRIKNGWNEVAFERNVEFICHDFASDLNPGIHV
jgi:hypothetical protein